jgi:hypothetical protein
LKVSVDQFPEDLYIPINNRRPFFMKFVYSINNWQSSINNEMGGGADMSWFSGKALDQMDKDCKLLFSGKKLYSLATNADKFISI